MKRGWNLCFRWRPSLDGRQFSLPTGQGGQSQDGFGDKYLYRLGGGDASEFISIFTVIFKTRCGGAWHRLRRLKEESNQC